MVETKPTSTLESCKAWIPMIPEDEAEGELKEWYDRLRDPWGGVDDIMRIHSISLPTMKGFTNSINRR